MKKYRRKIISLLLTAAMLITAVPILAAPDGDDYPAAPDEIIQTEAIAAEAAEAEQIETILTTEPEIEAIDAAANDGIEPAAEVASPEPTLNPKDEEIYIISAKFKHHPSTSSLFDEKIPNKLLWVEFSNKIDHTANFDSKTKVYSLDGKYYQLVIERPPHGPEASPHPAATLVPDNGISGSVKDMFSTGGNTTTEHRYHGWTLGNDLFDKDDTDEYQIGEYTAKLNKIIPPDGSTPAPDLENCEKKEVNSKTINIVQVTYTLSEADRQAGYKLKCPLEEASQDSITELAMEGDWITTIDPSLDYSKVSELDGKTVTISSWNIVTASGERKPIGNAVPSDNETSALFDGKQDNKITLEAVINEPKVYSYEFQKNDESGTAAFPTAPPATSAEPKPTAPPASYNDLLGADKIEYEPAATVTPLELRLANTGNQRIYVRSWTQDSNFTVETINVNKSKDNANELGSDGTIFYIPPKKEASDHDWENYALVKVTPKQGLAVGTYTTQINAMNMSGGSRVTDTYSLTVTIDRKVVKIAPKDTEKEYGQTLTPADIKCDVYNSQDQDIGTDLTAAELGITFKCDGMSQEAQVNGGTPYKFEKIEDSDIDSGNFEVTLKDDIQTGVTVKKATPVINRPVTATGITSGRQLSSSKLSGAFVNRNSHLSVEGSLEWVEPNKTITLEQSGTMTEQYKFTPNDQDNYNVPENGNVTIVVSAKSPINLTMSSVEKTYNGKAQTPKFSWNKGGLVEIGRNVTVVYKPVTDGNTEFADDEDFSEDGGYTSAAPINAGTYKVHATCNEDNIFAPGVANGIMTIKPYTLDSKRINLRNTINKVYDGTADAIADASKITYTKPKTDDEVSIVPGALRGTYINANADPYYVKNATLNVLTKEQFTAANPGVEVPATYPLTGKDAANYELSTETIHCTGTISRRPLSIKLKNEIHKHYGETYTFTASDCEADAAQGPDGGLAPSDSIENVKFELYTDQNAEAGATQVGSYDVKVRIPSGVSEYNYELDTSKPVGKIVIDKTTPNALSVNSDNGTEGQTLESLVDEHFTGSFENPYSHEILEGGTLEWENPQERLTKEKSKYTWKYTPEDQTNYNVLTGDVEIVVNDKPIAQILDFNVPKELTYDGESHPVEIKSNVANAQTTVEYRKLDIELHDAQAQEDEGWNMLPPVDAGTYQVRGTIYATEEYAENSIVETMTILQAEPAGTVTASSVDKGNVLTQSNLEYSFTGVKDEVLNGTIAWQEVGVTNPSEVVIEKEGSYDWIFAPESANYKTVTGKATVGVNENKRAPEVEIYNIPKDVVGGDYAYVDVDGINLIPGDVVIFYHDADMTNPLSADFKITEEMKGKTKVILDNELNTSGGTIYVNIKYSDTVEPVTYYPQIGFTINPQQIYVDANKKTTAELIPSHESYKTESVNWAPADTSVATADAVGDGTTATINGITGGSTRLDVTAVFTHPDSAVSDKITITGTALINVTAEEPPKYKYTTNDATEITETGAVLNGHVDITQPEGTTITPYASCKFELWETGSEEKTVYNSDTILNESGDYSVTVGDLKPGTTYQYQAFGTETTEAPAEIKEFTTLSTPEPSATPAPPTEAPSATPAPPTEAPSATPAPPTEAPSATPAPPTEAPSATPAPPTEAPSATPAPATEAPSATPAPATEAPSATPAPATEAPSATPAPATETPSATPAPPTEAPSATPAPPTEAPSATPAPVETATPAPVETATPDPGAPVRYDAAPVLNKDTATATITNNSGKSVWFIAAAYRDGVLIDIRFVEAPEGTNPVSAKFGSDYSADNSVSVTFYLWEKDTLKPCADPAQGK